MNSKLAANRTIKYAVLVIGAVIMGFPFVWMIANSLMGLQQIYQFPPSIIANPVEWENYTQAVDFVTPRAFLNSFIFTIGVTVGIIVLSLLSAYVFARLRLPGKNVIFLLYVASLLVPWQVTIVPQFIIVARLGWVNSFWGLIVPYLAQLSVGTFFFRQFFMRFPRDLYDAATIDGCSVPGVFWRVYLPLGVPAIASFGTVTALSAWNQYVWPLIVGQNKQMHTLTVALGILGSTRSTGAPDVGVILAASFLSMVPMLLIYIFAQRWFIEGIATSGLKY